MNTTIEDKYKSISVLNSNKERLETIGRELSEYHKKNLRIDKIIKYLLDIYDKINEKEKFYKLIKL